VPVNPNNKVFIHANKRTHRIMIDVFRSPGKWGVMSISKMNKWDHNETKKVINKLVSKGLVLVSNPSRKLYLTDRGKMVLYETNVRSSSQKSLRNPEG
jgi:predicted transcriptional regulator